MEKLFDSLSHEMQLILIVVGLAVLLFAVFANNKKNQSKLRDRKRRSFRERYESKKSQEE